MHRLLARQLKKIKADLDTPPSAEGWRAFLRRVEKSYGQIDQDRYLLERSLAISSEEMRTLYDQLKHSSEQKIAREQEKLRSIIASIGDGICALDDSGRVLLMNPAAQRLLLWDESDVIGQTLFDLIELKNNPFSDPQGIGRSVHETQDVGRVMFRNEDDYFRRRDGTLLSVSYVLNPIVSDGQNIGYVLVFHDISQRKAAEQEILQSRERLRQIYQSANDGIFIIDPESERIVEVNPRAAQMLGYPIEELCGMEVSRIHPAEMDKFRAFGQTVIQEGSSFTQKLSCTTRDQQQLPVEISASRLRLGERTLILADGPGYHVSHESRAGTPLGQRQGGGGQPAQESVPGHDEPRDPHAHERDDRDDRPVAGNRSH